MNTKCKYMYIHEIVYTLRQMYTLPFPSLQHESKIKCEFVV